MRQTVNTNHTNLLTFQNPQIKNLIPQSANTARDWIIQEFEQGKKAVIEDLAKAKSRITVSFDGWKADNKVLDQLGVVAH